MQKHVQTYKGSDNMKKINNEAIEAYENLLANKIKSFAPSFFIPEYRKRRICDLVDYFLKEKVHMTPEEALEKLDLATLKKWRLHSLLKYVEKPPEAMPNDVYHLIYYVYPDLPQKSFEERVIDTFHEVQEGKRRSFPRGYFHGVVGEKRAVICIRYLCEEVLKLSPEEIPKKLTEEVLAKYKLKILLNLLFTSMLDLITFVYPDRYTAEDFD